MKNSLVCSSLFLLLTACGGGGGSSSSTGQLSVGITDAPVDEASAVVVVFDGITLKPAGGEAIEIQLDMPLSLNLLDYQGENRAMLLDEETVPVGEYNWMRLAVIEDDSYIEVNGEQHALEIPSGAQTGLHLNRGFTVAAGGISDFTIDFDLRKSVHQEGTGDYKLRPTLRLVDSLEVGSVQGLVDSALITSESCNNGDNDDIGNAVYLFAADQTPSDVQGGADDPVASAAVVWNATNEIYEFTLGFVAEGEYILAFTCDASLDDPAEDNSAEMNFVGEQSIVVEAGDTTEVNFEAI